MGLAEPRGTQMPPQCPLGRDVRLAQHGGTSGASPSCLLPPPEPVAGAFGGWKQRGDPPQHPSAHPHGTGLYPAPLPKRRMRPGVFSPHWAPCAPANRFFLQLCRILPPPPHESHLQVWGGVWGGERLSWGFLNFSLRISPIDGERRRGLAQPPPASPPALSRSFAPAEAEPGCRED